MQSYSEELKSPKWFNLEPYPLDMVLITKSNKQIWNTDWLNNDLKDKIENTSIINERRVKTLKAVISKKEVKRMTRTKAYDYD